MKNFSLIFSFLVITSSFFISCGPSKDDAIKYNDTLISLQDLIVERDDVFLNSQGETPEKIKKSHDELLQQVNSSMEITEKMGAFSDYDDFRKACLDFLEKYKNVVENEYLGMMSVVSKPDSLISIEDNAFYDSLYDASIDKIERAAGELTKVQEEFAAKYKFNIAKDTLK